MNILEANMNVDELPSEVRIKKINFYLDEFRLFELQLEYKQNKSTWKVTFHQEHTYDQNPLYECYEIGAILSKGRVAIVPIELEGRIHSDATLYRNGIPQFIVYFGDNSNTTFTQLEEFVSRGSLLNFSFHQKPSKKEIITSAERFTVHYTRYEMKKVQEFPILEEQLLLEDMFSVSEKTIFETSIQSSEEFVPNEDFWHWLVQHHEHKETLKTINIQQAMNEIHKVLAWNAHWLSTPYAVVRTQKENQDAKRFTCLEAAREYMCTFGGIIGQVVEIEQAKDGVLHYAVQRTMKEKRQQIICTDTPKKLLAKQHHGDGTIMGVEYFVKPPWRPSRRIKYYPFND